MLRELLTRSDPKTYQLSKGRAFSSWRERPFKPYNFSACDVLPDSGHLLLLFMVLSQF